MTSKTKLRIAMLGQKNLDRSGGVEVVVTELATRMVKLGNNVTCYNRRGHHVSGKEFDSQIKGNYQGIRVKTVPTIDKKGLAAMTSSFFAAICCACGKYDVVHFHAEGPCAMLWIPKLVGKKCVATIHGLDHRRAKWVNGFGAKYILFGEKVAAKYADEIIVLSKCVQKYFKDTYNKETIFIPNGVNKPEKKDVDLIRQNYNLEKDSYILYLGRLVPEKGLSYLIKAFKSVKTDKKLVIAGGSSDTDDFFEEIKKLADGDDRIIFTGFVQGQMLEELYSNSYVYTLPSDLEGMPLSLLEAMSYGNCCLTSNIAECAEVVADNAVIFNKSDINDLKDKLQYLCDNIDVVEKYKCKASDYICSKYNWDDVVDATLRLY